MKMNKSEFIRLAALSKYSTWCEAEDYVAEQGTVTDQEMMEAMRIIGKYCAEHPHCVRCAIISHCGATPPQDWNFSELEVLRNG